MQASGRDEVERSGGRARVLTPAEKLLVGALLSGRSAPSASAIPRSTRQAATARIYQREWIRDRYVPNPAVLGWPYVTIAWSHPYADRLPEVSRNWAGQGGAVVVWRAHRTLFGVFFSRQQGDRQRLWASLSNPVDGTGSALLAQDLTNSAIPVFFDFEAAWARVSGIEGSASYPESLPRNARSSEAPPAASLTASERQAIERMVARPFVSSPRIAEHRPSLRSLFRGVERRCLRKGLVEARSFLNPVAIAREIAEFPSQVVFVRASLVPPSRPDELFRELVEIGGASPFLYTTDGATVLFASLAAGNQSRSTVRAVSGQVVLSILKRRLRSIQIVAENLGDLEVLVDHRYDRLATL